MWMESTWYPNRKPDWTFLPTIEISRLQREAEAEQLGHIARWELWNALDPFLSFF